MTACYLSNISAKNYKNPSMLSRVIAKNVGDVFLRHGVHTCTYGSKIQYIHTRMHTFKNTHKKTENLGKKTKKLLTELTNVSHTACFIVCRLARFDF